MLGPDARDLVGIRRDEASAAGACRHGRKSGPADACAPECRGPRVLHHCRAVAGAVAIDGLEILVLLQSETVEHIARQDDQAGAARTERDRLAYEIANGFCTGCRRRPRT